MDTEASAAKGSIARIIPAMAAVALLLVAVCAPQFGTQQGYYLGYAAEFASLVFAVILLFEKKRRARKHGLALLGVVVGLFIIACAIGYFSPQRS